MTSFTKILEKSCPAFNRLDISKERLASANITGNELRVLMIISYFTKSKGLCDVDNKTLELQFPKMNGNLFKYYLGNLQRKGMLFKKRVPIARIGGSRRILVTKDHWPTCHKFWFQKKQFKRAAELESYFTCAPVEFLMCLYNGRKVTVAQTLWD